MPEDQMALSRRAVLRTSLAGAMLAAAAGSARADTGTVVLSDFGGEWSDWDRKEIASEFKRRTGWSTNIDGAADNSARIAKISLGLPQGSYDIGCFADAFFARAEANGLLAGLDMKAPQLTNAADINPKFVTPNYASTLYNGLGMAYNPRLVKTPPTSWADMWNPAYKGRIVLPTATHSFGMHVVLLCAMAAGKDYKDLDAAFAKLKELAALQPIWALDSQAIMHSLRDEEAVIGWIGRGEHLQIVNGGGDIKFVIPQEGGFLTSWAFAPIKNTHHMPEVLDYVNTSLDPKIQAAYATYWGFHPTNRKWTEFATPEVVKRVSFTPEEETRFVSIDYKWLDGQRAGMTDRWNRVVGG